MFYAQHHGLPTPLIDITENPLTALYFACSSNYMEDECVVYAFDKLRFINLLEFNNTDEMTLNNFFFDNQFTLQVLIGISNLDSQKNEIIY